MLKPLNSLRIIFILNLCLCLFAEAKPDYDIADFHKPAYDRISSPPFFSDDASFEQQFEWNAKPKKIKPKISIIVDDLGDNSIIAEKIILLPAPLTLAILPHTPFAKLIAERGTSYKHEIIMHLPMEATSRPDLLGPGALFSNMSQAELLATFLSSAESVPELVGFNNHMGSLLTKDLEKMRWIMKLAAKKHWYFLDSKTSQNSIAQKVAKNIGVASIGRDIFLDHHSEKSELPRVLERQFEKLKKLAHQRGHVVVICHPYQQTYDFLAKKLPGLNEEFDLVRLSELLDFPELKVALKN